jgi:hypothetical protein
MGPTIGGIWKEERRRERLGEDEQSYSSPPSTDHMIMLIFIRHTSLSLLRSSFHYHTNRWPP